MLIVPAGMRFGKLVVMNEIGRSKCGQRKFRLQCDCGLIAAAVIGNLRSGNTRSCGCLRNPKRTTPEAKLARIEKANQQASIERTGLTNAEFLRMDQQQRGLCAICQQPERKTGRNGNRQRLSVDHSHARGNVRGLLCSGCNLGLGYFQEDAGTMRRAIDYLDAHNDIDRVA